MPAPAAGLPSSTPRTSRPSRSGRPTARRMRRATRGGATATPSRGGCGCLAAAKPRRALLDGRGGRHREDQAAVEAHGVQPEQASLGVDERTARRAARKRGGVLDRSAIRRPRGPRKLRPSDETKPSVTRRPRPPGLASASTGGADARRARRAPRRSAGRRRCRPRAPRGRGRGRRPPPRRWRAGRPRRRRSPARRAGCGRS